jgi:hypothetical protein
MDSLDVRIMAREKEIIRTSPFFAPKCLRLMHSKHFVLKGRRRSSYARFAKPIGTVYTKM